jgi:hypothetical protein
VAELSRNSKGNANTHLSSMLHNHMLSRYWWAQDTAQALWIFKGFCQVHCPLL